MTDEEKKEQLRLELRQRAKDSLYFLARGVLGYKEMVPHLHLDLAKFLQMVGLRKIILVPRGHFKTTLCTQAYAIWLIINNPNVRILITSATEKNASKMLAKIKAVFETNETFRWLFPEIIPGDFNKVRWSATEMEVARTEMHGEATVEVLGVGGQAASRHYDVQIKDDLVNEETFDSEAGMERVIAHHQYAEGLFVRPEAGIDVVVGTRWAFNDYYSHILDEDKEYKPYIRSAIEQNQPIFPERFSVPGLMALKKRQGEYKFASQYMNDPSNEATADFKLAWLRYYSWGADGMLYPKASQVQRMGGTPAILKPVGLEMLNIYAQVDPAVTEDKAKILSSRSAITIEGIDSDSNVYVLEAWADRCTPIELINQMFLFQVKYAPIQWAIESVAYQAALAAFVADEAMRRHTYLNVEQVHPGMKHKDARIRGLQSYFFNQKVFMHESMFDLIKEYTTFPNGKTKDLLDAMAYGPDMWDAPEPYEDDESRADRYGAQHRTCNPHTGY